MPGEAALPMRFCMTADRAMLQTPAGRPVMHPQVLLLCLPGSELKMETKHHPKPVEEAKAV